MCVKEQARLLLAGEAGRRRRARAAQLEVEVVGDVGGGEGEAGHQLLAEHKHQVSGLWEARYVIVLSNIYISKLPL